MSVRGHAHCGASGRSKLSPKCRQYAAKRFLLRQCMHNGGPPQPLSHIADRFWSMTAQCSFAPVVHVVGHPLQALLVFMHDVALIGKEVLYVMWVLLRENCHHYIKTLDPHHNISYGLLAFQCNDFILSVVSSNSLNDPPPLSGIAVGC